MLSDERREQWPKASLSMLQPIDVRFSYSLQRTYVSIRISEVNAFRVGAVIRNDQFYNWSIFQTKQTSDRLEPRFLFGNMSPINGVRGTIGKGIPNIFVLGCCDPLFGGKWGYVLHTKEKAVASIFWPTNKKMLSWNTDLESGEV